MWFFTKVPKVTTADFKQKLSSKPYLIDVRTTEEYISGHIPGAKNTPIDNLYQFDFPKNQDIYVICQSGSRSIMAAKMLKHKGYQTINIEGGMMLWSGPMKMGKN